MLLFLWEEVPKEVTTRAVMENQTKEVTDLKFVRDEDMFLVILCGFVTIRDPLIHHKQSFHHQTYR